MMMRMMVTVRVIIEYNRIDDKKWSPPAAFFLPTCRCEFIRTAAPLYTYIVRMNSHLQVKYCINDKLL